MASTYLDDFVLNFDLNHLTNEENVQTVEQKYEKLRRTTSWLKSKIISTDFAIQKYQAKKDHCEQSVKAHSIIREELKQVCINYKDASDKCAKFEKENKILLASQEVLKERLKDSENKYSALTSHSNQLQMLVKQLETEKEALRVENELDKCNNKDRNHEVIGLQKEKDAMLNDFTVLKDVILGKKKTCKRHIKLLKKYVKGIKWADINKYKSEESDNDEIDNYSNFSLTPRILDKVHNFSEKPFTSCEDQNFADICSDSSNGEISGRGSVDTGRGSSRANSHDKYISSPDYAFNPEIPLKNIIKHIDVANSPIRVHNSQSAATSPIIFEEATEVFDDKYDCIDSPEHTIDYVGLSEDLNIIQETDTRDKFKDVCTSPLPDLRRYVDIGTSPVKNNEYVCKDNLPTVSLIIDQFEIEEPNLVSEKQAHQCFCENVNDKKKFLDACTSPAPELGLRDVVEIGTNTVNDAVINLHHDSEIKDQTSKNAIFTTLEQRDLFDMEMNEIRNDRNETSIRKSLLFDQEDLQQVLHEKISNSMNDKPTSTVQDKVTLHPAEKLRSQEKDCLESNSSKNLHLENTTDSEVEHILNVMKLHHDIISPISKTPSDSHYLKLLPEMNLTLSKIWAALSNICKSPIRNNDSNMPHVTIIEDVPEEPTNNNEKRLQSKHLTNNKEPNIVMEEDMIDITQESNKNVDDICEDIIVLESANMIVHEESNDPELNETESDIYTNKEISSVNKTDIAIVTEEEDERLYPEKQPKERYIDFIYEDDIINSINKNNIKICNGTTGNPVVSKVKLKAKMKNKSKLEKFRKKLLPISKIKKTYSPLVKRPPKIYNTPTKDTTSSSLNQKIAYDKAVKVMAAFRSNKEVLHKTKALATNSNKTEFTIPELVEDKTATRGSDMRLCGKQEDTIIVAISPKTLEKNINDEETPLKRKLRKRPADTEIDSVQSCKRVLRSSNVSQAIKKELPIVAKSIGVDCLHVGGRRKSKTEKHNDINNCLISSHDYAGSEYILERNVKIMKPVIDLSKCLNDNVTGVSITPGNGGHLNVTTNIDQMHNRAVNFDSHVLNDHSYYDTRSLDLCKSNDVLFTAENVISSNTDHDYYSEKQIINNITVTEKNNSIVCTKGDKRSKDNGSNKEILDRNKHTYNAFEVLNRKDHEEQNLLVSKNDLASKKDKSLKVMTPEKAKETMTNPVVELIPLKNYVLSNCINNVVNYSDLDLYAMESKLDNKIQHKPLVDTQRRKENILCAALDRYGVISVKYTAKKVPDLITLNICQKIEESIQNIITSSKNDQKKKMDHLVTSIQNYKPKYILSGLMKYLKDPTRKNELFNTVTNGAAPPMTRSEMILLYVIEKLNAIMPPGFINRVWNNIEHALFQLNRAPEFVVIESMSHFYAVLCRYFRNKSRLRCFMLDAMYCLQFKAVPLIRQCLEVCPGVLPYAHERMAKTSLVTCLVYLLHFYKCQDKFNRAQDIRNILYRKYSYRFSEWNETMILEIFRKAIMDLRGTHNDKKMLRVALIILCKRHGPKWCQLNIVRNMLLPIIEKRDVPERIKHFCVLMLGPLLKPFPADKKAECEIVINQLLQMLKEDNSQAMNEAIYSSLIFMNKHDQDRVVQTLLSWNPERVSPEFEEILNDYVMEKPLAVWKRLVTRKPSQCT